MPTIGTFKNFTGMNPIACIADSAKFVQSAKVLADQIVVNVSDYKSIVNDINGVLTIVENFFPIVELTLIFLIPSLDSLLIPIVPNVLLILNKL